MADLENGNGQTYSKGHNDVRGGWRDYIWLIVPTCAGCVSFFLGLLMRTGIKVPETIGGIILFAYAIFSYLFSKSIWIAFLKPASLTFVVIMASEAGRGTLLLGKHIPEIVFSAVFLGIIGAVGKYLKNAFH